MLRSRHRRIIRFFAIVLLRTAFWEYLLPRIGFRVLSERGRSERMRRIAVSFRELAIAMGGVLIKVGQFLSARLDVLPREITGELSGLQDEVGAESAEAIRQVVEAELGAPIEERFAEFEPSPIASASIGQVHRARLSGESPDARRFPSIVVKVQRPNIEEIVRIDLAAITTVGGWVKRFRVVRRHMNVPALIEEFSRTLFEEIDYLAEGRNAERFESDFRERRDIRVPQIVWSHTTRRVLTLEDVGAIKIDDYQAIEGAGIDRGAVAERLVDAYLKQLFEDGFFHADPHPGNLFVHPRGAGSFELTFVDFGMTGVLPSATFAGLREALIAVGTRDAGRLVEAYRRLGILMPGADLDLVEAANRRVFEHFWGRSMGDMRDMSQEEMDAFVSSFEDLLYDMPFQVPQHLILLGRCVAILSGLATGLDADFNVWRSIGPYAEKLVADEAGDGFSRIMKEVGDAARVVASLPKRTESLLDRLEGGRFAVRIPELKGHVTRLEYAVRKLGGSIIFATFVLSATLLLLNGKEDFAVGLGSASAILLFWLLFGR